MLNLYFILLLLLFSITTANYSKFSFFRRANEPDVGLQDQQTNQQRTIEYDFDLNKTPPKDSDGSPEHFHQDQQKKSRGRPRIYATKEEKRAAELKYRKRYRKEYTISEIEKTKKVLQGEKLKEFMKKANKYQTKAKIRQKRFHLKQALQRTLIESQKVAQRALNYHEKMKKVIQSICRSRI